MCKAFTLMFISDSMIHFSDKSPCTLVEKKLQNDSAQYTCMWNFEIEHKGLVSA